MKPLPVPAAAESAIIGAILRNTSAAMREIQPPLTLADFADPTARAVWAWACDRHAAGLPVDLTLAADALRGRVSVEALTAFMDACAAVAFSGSYADEIRETSKRRALLSFADRVSEIASRPDTAPDMLREEIAALVEADRGNGPTGATARALADIPRADPADGKELLRHRFLCREGALLLVGPAGVGKSALLLQFLLTWATGRAALGIEPARPLRSVLIQSEDDDGDLAEFRDGILAGLVDAGTLTHAEAAAAARAVFVLSAPDAQGDRLPPLLRRMIADHAPDLVALNPAFGFVSGDTNTAADVGAFLRGLLNPIIKRAGVGLVLVHHSNKPPTGRERADLRAGDNAYLGAGSAEWANYARAVLAIKSLGSPTVFELVAGKRGKRLRWQDADGLPTITRHIAHATEPGRIFWRTPDPAEIAEAAAVTGDLNTRRAPGRDMGTLADRAAAMLADKPLSLAAFKGKIQDKLHVGEHKAREILEQVRTREGIACAKQKCFGGAWYIGPAAAVESVVSK